MDQQPETISGRKVTRKILKWTAILAGSGLVLVLAAYLLLVSFLDHVIRNQLPEKVREASDGLYALQFGEVAVNRQGFRFSLIIRDIRFSTDPAQYRHRLQQPGAPPDYYRITADSLYLGPVSVWPLFRGQGVHVPGIHLSQPAVFLQTQPDDAAPPPRPLLVDLHEQIRSYVPWLTVDSVHLQQGQFQYVQHNDADSTELTIPHFSVQLHSVLIDENSGADTSRVLYSESIAVQAASGFRLRTGLYELNTDSSHFSTAEGSRITRIQLNTQADLPDEPQLNVTVPELSLGYLDWRQALHAEGIYASAVHLQEPEVSVRVNGPAAEAYSGNDGFTLHEAIQFLTPWLQIDTLSIEKGRAEFTRASDQDRQQYTVAGVDLLMEDLRVDSAAAQDSGRLLYARTLELSVREKLTIVEDIYTVQTGYLRASTRQGMQASGLRLSTDNAAARQRGVNTYEILLDSMYTDFPDWHLLTGGHEIAVPPITITRPEIRLIIREPVKPANAGEADQIHQLISALTPRLRIDAIKIEQGDLSLVHAATTGSPALRVHNWNLELRDIQIDSASARDKNRVFYTNRIDFTVLGKSHFTQAGLTAEAASLRASTAEGITLTDVRVSANAAAGDTTSHVAEARIFVPYLFAGFRDWDALVSTEGITLSGLEVRRPEIRIAGNLPAGKNTREENPTAEPYTRQQLLTLHQSLPPVVPWLRIDSVRIRDGSLNYVQAQASGTQQLRVPDFHLRLDDVLISPAGARDENRTLYTQNVQLKAEGLNFVDDRYTLTLDQAIASTLAGIHLSGIALIPKPSAPGRKPDRNIFSGRIREISVPFTEWNDLIRAQPIRLEEIVVQEPHVRLIAPDEDEHAEDETGEAVTGTSEPTENEPLYEAIRPFIPQLQIEQVRINAGSFEYAYDLHRLHDYRDAATDFWLVFDDIRIDSAAAYAPERTWYTRDIRLKVRKYTHISRDSLYAFTIHNAQASTAEQRLSVTELQLQPRYSIDEFYRRVETQSDIVQLSAAQLDARGMNFKELLQNRSLIIAFAEADDLQLRFYRDRNIPLPENDQDPALPLDVFRQLDTYVRFDSIRLRKGYVEYTEVAVETQNAGTLFFDRLHAEVYNLTNDSLRVSSANPVIFRGQGRLMGEGKTNLTMEFPIYSDTSVFRYVGSIGQMDLTRLNSLIEKFYSFRIRRGTLDELTAQASGGPEEATGVMCAFYRDFEIDLLEDQIPLVNGPMADFTAFLANRFVLNTHNRRRSWQFTPALIQINRTPNRNVFNYFWSTVRDGIMGSTGFRRVQRLVPVF